MILALKAKAKTSKKSWKRDDCRNEISRPPAVFCQKQYAARFSGFRIKVFPALAKTVEGRVFVGVDVEDGEQLGEL